MALRSNVQHVVEKDNTKVVQNLINHVALVIDGSGSMQHLSEAVVKVADELVSTLAARSKETDQETRISLYVFEDTNRILCHTYDKDVLRMPSLKGLYRAVGYTPLIDATIKSIDDLSQTATLYGDHAFLVYVLTDGGENRSKAKAADLTKKLNGLNDNWTLACFVPDRLCRDAAVRYGFPEQNVQIWETSAKGMETLGATMAASVSSYYTMRASGIRGSRNLFSMGLDNLSKSAVAKKLTPLHYGQYKMYEVRGSDLPRGEGKGVEIASFVESKRNRPYKLGEGYYQLVKVEKVQPQKNVCIFNKKTAELFHGPEARKVVGLPDYEVKVGPEHSKDFDIFIQSTSTNRKLVPGQKLVVMSI